MHGDSSCAELSEVIHCRNCKAYKKAAVEFFKKEAGNDYKKGWTKYFAQQVKKQPEDNIAVVVFRIGIEMLCIASEYVVEITEARNVHTIPHHSNNILKGIVNIRGRVLLCVNLGSLLGIEPDEREVQFQSGKSFKRMIVSKYRSDLWVFPVDMVEEVMKISKQNIENVPDTAAKLYGGYTKGIIPWQNRHIGFIDEEVLFRGLERSL